MIGRMLSCGVALGLALGAPVAQAQDAPPPPVEVEQLPVNVMRFAASDVAGQRRDSDVVAEDAETPPPVVRTAALQ